LIALIINAHSTRREMNISYVISGHPRPHLRETEMTERPALLLGTGPTAKLETPKPWKAQEH